MTAAAPRTAETRSADVITFGCRLNAYESAHIEQLTAGRDDLVVVNTCAVTAEAERQARQAIRKLRRDRPEAKIVVTGCAAQIDPGRFAAMPEVDRVVGNGAKLDPRSWSGDDPVFMPAFSADPETAGHLTGAGTDRARAFLQVQNGCDHSCTFCIIPKGRGPSRSVPIGAIADRLASLVGDGVREVVLTGVDLTSYGHDLPGTPTLGQMIRRVLVQVPDLPRLRLSSLDPQEIDPDLWRLIAEDPRLMPHLHLSVQAGDDLVLKRMKRRHNRAGALAACRKAKQLRPEIALGADLIAGFPTETEEMFARTLDFVAEADLTFLHVFPYSERPGTPAARMPSVPKPVRRDRAARLRAAGDEALRRRVATRLGRDASILVEDAETGRTEDYLSVSLPRPASVGTVIPARLAAAGPYRLMAIPQTAFSDRPPIAVS